jgi:hypothetical protein
VLGWAGLCTQNSCKYYITEIEIHINENSCMSVPASEVITNRAIDSVDASFSELETFQ